MSFECLDIDLTYFEPDDNGYPQVLLKNDGGFEIIEGEQGGLSLTQFQRAPVWTAFVPVFHNLTIGNGALTARYFKVNKLVHYSVSFTFGSTSSMTGQLFFDAPIAMDRSSGQVEPIGEVWMEDTGNNNWEGISYQHVTQDWIVPCVFRADSTYKYLNAVSAGAPFAWGVGDSFQAKGWYKAL